MPKFKVNITETLFKEIEIEAKDKEEALDKTIELYKRAEIVLDASNFEDVKIKLVDDE